MCGDCAIALNWPIVVYRVVLSLVCMCVVLAAVFHSAHDTVQAGK